MREFLLLELLLLLLLVLTVLLLLMLPLPLPLPPLWVDNDEKPVRRLLSAAFAFSFSYGHEQHYGVRMLAM